MNKNNTDKVKQILKDQIKDLSLLHIYAREYINMQTL